MFADEKHGAEHVLEIVASLLQFSTALFFSEENYRAVEQVDFERQKFSHEAHTERVNL